MAAWPARRTSFLFLASLIAAQAAAAPTAPLGPARATPKAAHAGALEEMVRLPSYRAEYAMQIQPRLRFEVQGQSSGRMMLEWIDSCDGYSLHQRYVADFVEGGDTQTRIDFNGLLWEEKSGAAFRFDMAQTVNEAETEADKGQADRKTVRFDLPAGETAEMPKDAVFPAVFTRQVIAAALRGEHFLSARLFEGSSEDPFPRVTALIGPPVAQSLEDGERPRVLAGYKSWMVSLSYFNGAGDTGPDYTLRSRLYENGMSDDLLFDYPDFIMTGHLVQAQYLTAPDCK